MGAVIRLVTWNLQGLAGVDTEGVEAILGPLAVDVLTLQEVQRGQARTVAVALGMRHRWAFKHWPFPRRREGLAVLTAHHLVSTDVFVLRRAAPWNWRRRVALRASLDVNGERVDLVVVHLSPHRAAADRAGEIRRLLTRVGDGPAAIVGDFNDGPGGPSPAALLARGWRDAWSERHGDVEGPTNWTPGRRIGRAPTQRIDYVFVPAPWRIEGCRVVDTPLGVLAELSDHLPLIADVAIGASP